MRYLTIGILVSLLLVVLPWPSPAEGSSPGACHLDPQEAGYSKCGPFYVCKKSGSNPSDPNVGTCVCAWGFFEVLPASTGSNICAYLQSFGRGASPRQVLGNPLAWIANWMIAFTVMVAAVNVVVAGYIYATAGGDASRIQRSKVWLGAAMLAIVIAASAYMFLRIVARNLV